MYLVSLLQTQSLNHSNGPNVNIGDKGGNNFANKHLDACDGQQKKAKKKGLLENILQSHNWFLYI